MSKHMTTGRVVRYLLCVSLVGVLIMGATYARYTQEVQGEGSASVAAVTMDVTDGSSSQLDITSQLQGMAPNNTREVKFAVTNKKDSIVSEVSLEYSLSIETTGNLPLTYTLAGESGGSADNYVKPSADGSNLVWTGGLLPWGSTDSGTTHVYTLTVTWPADKADESLADEIDLVTLTVDAQQVVPSS